MSIIQTSVGSLAGPSLTSTAEPAVDLVESPVSAIEIERQWRLLGDRMGSPMQRYQWSSACADAFASSGAMRICMVNRDGNVVALAPMVHRRMDGVRHLAMVGSFELHEPMDLIYRDVDALERLLQSMLASGAPLFLERVPADSPTVAAVNRLHPRSAIVIQRPQALCPYTPLDASWREPESHLKSSRRSDLRRAMRKAQQRGPVTVEILRPKPQELEPLLQRAFEIEAASWKGRAGTALLYDSRRADFFRRYSRSAAADGTLRLCFLKIGDEFAAMQLAVECYGAFWLLKIGYDDRFAECSPGQLLIRETIRYAVECGLSSYEFLGSAAAWTQVWTQHERPCVSLWAYPNSMRGISALSVRAARAVWHRWRR